MKETTTTLWFYLRSASPIYTYTLPSLDARLTQVLEDVRKIRHGNHVFVHLRSQYEWERAMDCLGVTNAVTNHAPSPAA